MIDVRHLNGDSAFGFFEIEWAREAQFAEAGMGTLELERDVPDIGWNDVAIEVGRKRGGLSQSTRDSGDFEAGLRLPVSARVKAPLILASIEPAAPGEGGLLSTLTSAARESFAVWLFARFWRATLMWDSSVRSRLLLL